MLRESDSNVGHFMTSPKGHVLRTVLRFEKSLPTWLKSKVLSPLRQPAPPAESPSTNTSFLPSGEKAGTIMTALPSPQLLALCAETLTGAVPTVFESCQIT